MDSTNTSDTQVTKTQNAFRKHLVGSVGHAISLTGVTKTFGSTVAVDDLDLAVPRARCTVSSDRTAPEKRRRSG